MASTPTGLQPPLVVQMLLLLQTDVTARVEMEVRMTALNETQINLLDQVGMGIRCVIGHTEGVDHPPGSGGDGDQVCY